MTLMLFVKHLFRDINARVVVYFLYPILYGIAVLTLIFNSWLFFSIISISFFFSMDAVLIQAKDRVLDISKFYARPRSFNRLVLDYFTYRLQISFLFAYVPSTLIGTVFLSGMQPKLPLLWGDSGYFYYLVFATLSWILYVLLSTPLLLAGLRSKSALEVIKAPGYLFYLGFFVTQLVALKFPVPFSAILGLYIVIFLVILCIGYYFTFEFIRQEKIFP